MLKRLLSCCVLVMCFIFPSFADDECPAGYGYKPTMEADSGGCVDLGTLNWSKANDTGRFYATGISDGKYEPDSVNIYAKGLITFSFNDREDAWSTELSIFPAFHENRVFVQDARYTDAASFKQAMSGVILYYQRATDESWRSPSENTVCQFDTSSYEPYGEYVLPEIRECTLCPPNTYKDFVGNSECVPCPNGTMSPAGAKSADECGHILHVGDYIAFMPVGKRTEHGLCTMLGGVKYCADLYERQ